MKQLALNDKIVLALLHFGACQGGFENRGQGSIPLLDGYTVSDFEFLKGDIVTFEGDNITISVNKDDLSAVVNFYGKHITIYALKYQLDLANKIVMCIEAQCHLAGIECPKQERLTYIFSKYERIS
jgi:hypothetical protein